MIKMWHKIYSDSYDADYNHGDLRLKGITLNIWSAWFYQRSISPKIKYFLNELDMFSINEDEKSLQFTPLTSPTPIDKNISRQR